MMKYLLSAMLCILLTMPVMAEPLPDLSVALLSYAPNPVQPGQTIDLTLEVANEGNPADNIRVELLEEYPFTLTQTEDALRAQNLRVVSGTQKLQFRVKVAETAQDGLTTMTVRYGRADELNTYQEVSFNILIETFGARIGIDAIQQEPKKFLAGREGTLALTLTNYDDQTLKNIDVIFDMTNTYDMSTNMDNTISVQAMINARLEEVNRRIAAGLSPLAGVTPMGVMPDGTRPEVTFKTIAPTGSATLKRIGPLESGETITITIPVQAMPQAAVGIHALPIYINYNDEDNNPFHTRTEIPIILGTETTTFVELKSSSLRSTDFAGNIEVLVANQGIGELRYASIELLESDQYTLITAPSRLYLGTLEQGASSNASFFILPHEEDLDIPVRLTYRDGFNELKQKDYNLQLTIINRNYYRDMPYEMMLPWVILALVVLALTMYYFRKMKT